MSGYLRSVRPDGMNRRVHNAMVALDHAQRFHVIDEDGESHGSFVTLDEARGCVAFDGLRHYSIVQGDWNVVVSA